jgi:hypothetical protein
MTHETDPTRTAAERVLRAVLVERAADVTPPADLEARVRRHNQVRRRLLVAGAAAAAVLVAGGLPAGLTLVRADAPPARPEPSPSPAPSCPPVSGLPATATPTPASPRPRQTGVRGSLAGDSALVDAVLAVGRAALGAELDRAAEDRQLDNGTVRVRLVERAGAGVVALVTGADRTGRWQAGQWVVREGGRLRAAGILNGFQGPVRDQRLSGRFFAGEDPLVIDTVPVCGQRYGVVLAPPDATAELTPPPAIAPDGQLVHPPAGRLALARGLAVVPLRGPGEFQLAVTRDAELVGYTTFRSSEAWPSPAGWPADELARAVREAAGEVDPELAERVADVNRRWVARTTADKVTGLRMVWGGRLRNGEPVLLSALTLSSGAQSIVAGRGHRQGGASTIIGNFHRAGPLEDTVFAWRDHDYVIVVALRAARAEVVQPSGAVLPVPLTEGGGSVVVPNRAFTLVRAYAADGSLLGRQPAGNGGPLFTR